MFLLQERVCTDRYGYLSAVEAMVHTQSLLWLTTSSSSDGEAEYSTILIQMAAPQLSQWVRDELRPKLVTWLLNIVGGLCAQSTTRPYFISTDVEENLTMIGRWWKIYTRDSQRSSMGRWCGWKSTQNSKRLSDGAWARPNGRLGWCPESHCTY